jgi:hypothetical protein
LISFTNTKKSKWLTVNIYDEDEIVFNIWEREFPISVNPRTREICTNLEGYNWKLSKDMLEEIVCVMSIIEENMDEI